MIAIVALVIWVGAMVVLTLLARGDTPQEER